MLLISNSKKQNEIIENHKKEQFLEIKSIAKQEQELKIITSNFRKEKLLIKDIRLLAIPFFIKILL
ncbi:hypothetical protein D6D54_00795 [Spiroplasma poulsonii]|uniref:Uncharacterized protein n=1 Tax=Spiroplasma poulsonii TaxID=2138 RepID=A0A433ET14_9MOLU|nr:hypothetical protein [Spiroplasma poulsonii]RUP78050.1 hypothetical protein D6D54_00795 [Spiroplasma poulsonii]